MNDSLIKFRNVRVRAQQALSVLRLKSFDVTTPEGRSMERYRRIAIFALSSLAAKVVSTATILISVPLTLNYLGQERFGLWATLTTLIGFLALTDLGVGNALVNAIAKAMGKDDRSMVQRVVSGAFCILSLQGLLLIVVYTIVQSHVDWSSVFNVHSETAKIEIGAAIAVLVGIIAVQLPLAMVQRVQEGFQEGFANNFWQTVASCMGLGGLLIVVHFRLGLPWLVATVAGAPIAAALINSFVQFWFHRPWLRPSLHHVDWAVSGGLIHSGSVFLVLSFLTFCGIYSDNLVISRMLDASAVTEYAVVQRLSLVAHLFWAFLIPLWPAYGEAMARGDFKWMLKTFTWSLIFSITAGLTVGAVLVFFGLSIIRLWVGSDVNIDLSLLYGFASYITISGVIGSISVVLSSGPFLRKQLWIIAAAALVSLWLKVILCARYGVSGVIWATVISYSLLYILPGLWMINRFLGSSVAERTRRSA